ncbi:hypothetical protein P9272_02040 [Mesorhizobium sp. WSM4976]|uniref:hypothetical protein n=1 Tax=Mesorhizobium sp. WSM4976 TaxID=3038549 RepID=UPI0024172221|nr:hypothetical protein [Mesorhizobium sp. WSM4976]MDG4892383.1 hypothetical protein [Mesorhizobium sp. WSM4976]
MNSPRVISGRCSMTLPATVTSIRQPSSLHARNWRIRNPPIERELLLAMSSQRPTTTVIRALTSLIRDEVRILRKLGVWEPRPPSPDLERANDLGRAG